MLIKCANFHLPLSLPIPPIIFLIGSELFHSLTIAEKIKQLWNSSHPEDNTTIIQYLENDEDWAIVRQEAAAFSLFSSQTLVDVRYDKKTLSKQAKDGLVSYCNTFNPQNLLLIRAPYLTLTQIQPFVRYKEIAVIQLLKLNQRTILQWISERLKSITSQFDAQIPILIQQYTVGNLLACSQIIEKLSLLIEPQQYLSLDILKEHLSEQCSYALFELSDALLEANLLKSIQFLRHARHNKTEPPLVLWAFTQEIRTLLQLLHLNKTMSFKAATEKLKIWSNKTELYQKAIQRVDNTFLHDALTYCSHLDLQIKTNKTALLWNSFEQLAISLCKGIKLYHA